MVVFSLNSLSNSFFFKQVLSSDNLFFWTIIISEKLVQEVGFVDMLIPAESLNFLKGQDWNYPLIQLSIVKSCSGEHRFPSGQFEVIIRFANYKIAEQLLSWCDQGNCLATRLYLASQTIGKQSQHISRTMKGR